MNSHHPRYKCDLEVKDFTCYKGNNRGKRFYRYANFISKENSECDFFQLLPENEGLKLKKEMEDNLSMR